MARAEWWLLAAVLIWSLPAATRGQASSPEAALEEALEELQEGRSARGRELLEDTVERWPNYRQAHYHIGRLALDRGDLDLAEEHLAFAAEGDFPRAFSAWYLLGRTRVLQRDFDGAVAALDVALDKAPRFELARMERGRAQLFRGRIDDGIADLRAMLEVSEPPQQVLLLLSQLAMLTGEPEQARSLAERLVERSAGDDRWREQGLWLLEATSSEPEARAALARAVEESPDAGELYWSLAMTYREIDPGRTRRLLRVAMDQESENPLHWLSLLRFTGETPPPNLPAAVPGLRAATARSVHLWSEGRFEESREIAARLLETGRFLVGARLLVARDAARREDLWQAAREYQQLLDWLGSVPSIARSLAEVAQAMRAADLAECSIGLALEGDPGDGSLPYLAAVIAKDRGDTETAIRRFHRALELGFEDARVWLRLGELYFEQMRIEESIAAYEQAMATDPAAAEAVRAFALSSLTTEQYQSLRQILEAHLREHPENLNTLYTLGVMNLRDGNLVAAREYLLRLAELAPEHRQVHYNLGQIYLRQGETEAGQSEMEVFRRIRASEDAEWERHNQAHIRRVAARKWVQEGQPERAIPLYTESIEEATAEFSDYEELAGAQLAAGDIEEALRRYQGILSADAYHRGALEGEREAALLLGDERSARQAQDRLSILDWPCKMDGID